MITFTKPLAISLMSSQNGEDGLLQECLKRIRPLYRVCAEVGAYDGNTWSNTQWLIKELGWDGVMIEANEENYRQCSDYWFSTARVTCIKAKALPRNINDLLPPCSVLSLDIDGGEFELWQAYNFSPIIVIIEIDSSLDPTDPKARNNMGGVGYLPMVNLGLRKGYFLLSHVGNLIFVQNHYRPLFPEITAGPIDQWQEYFNPFWLNQRTADK